MTAERAGSDETGRLMRVISALSAAPEAVGAAGRHLIAEPEIARDLLDALLAEVNETVLRRHLTFAGLGAAMLRLDVKERRIVQVLCLEHAHASCSPDCVDRPLTPEDAAKVLQVLRAFCNGSDRLTVRTHLPDVREPDVFGGVSCGDLEACLGRQNAKPALNADILAARDLTEQHAVAMVCAEADTAIERWGSEADCDILERLLPALQEATGPKEVRLWPEGLRDNLALLTARQSDLLVLALLPRGEASACFAHWHDVIVCADS